MVKFIDIQSLYSLFIFVHFFISQCLLNAQVSVGRLQLDFIQRLTNKLSLFTYILYAFIFIFIAVCICRTHTA